MRLEELRDFKKGTIAEIEFLNYAEYTLFASPNSAPLFRVHYVDGVVSIVPALSIFSSRSSDFREVEHGEKALKVYNFRRRHNVNDQKFEYLNPNYILLEDILSFRPIEQVK